MIIKSLDPRHLNQTQVASLLDISLNTIKRWVAAGCPQREKTKRHRIPGYDMADILKWKTKQSKESKKTNGEDPDLGGEIPTEQLEKWRLVKTEAAQFDLDVKKGIYIEKDDHDTLMRAAGDHCRQGFQNMPKKMAIKLSKLRDSTRIEKALEEEIISILKKLAVEPKETEDDA